MAIGRREIALSKPVSWVMSVCFSQLVVLVSTSLSESFKLNRKKIWLWEALFDRFRPKPNSNWPKSQVWEQKWGSKCKNWFLHAKYMLAITYYTLPHRLTHLKKIYFSSFTPNVLLLLEFLSLSFSFKKVSD